MDRLSGLPLSTIAITLGGIQVAKRIPFDDPDVLNSFRALLLFTKLVILGLLLYIRHSIKGRRVVARNSAPPGNSTSTKKKAGMTASAEYDHDMAQWWNLIKGETFAICIVSLLHLYFKLNPPLIAQSIIPLKGLLQSKLARIHIFKDPAEGRLARPFEDKPGVISRATRYIRSMEVVGGNNPRNTKTAGTANAT